MSEMLEFSETFAAGLVLGVFLGHAINLAINVFATRAVNMRK